VGEAPNGEKLSLDGREYQLTALNPAKLTLENSISRKLATTE
jgi:hypothetical protein